MRTRPRGYARVIAPLLALPIAWAVLSRCRPAPVAPAFIPDIEQPLALFDGHGDIGPVVKPGTVVEEAAVGGLIIEGAGANMWFGSDEGHFLWKRLKGDFIVNARAEFLGEGVEAHRKIGWMVRTNTDPGSAHASAVVHGDGLTSLQYRRTPGADTEEIPLPISGADQIQLERRGDTYIMSAARFGEPYESRSVAELGIAGEALVGLFVCSHNADVSERARFTNVRVTVPAPADLVPYRDHLGGTIELLDVDTGRRTPVFRSDRPIQAPNWTKDGRFLIFNVDGRLDRLDLATGKVSALDTGFAKANNNDHVLSFDGKRLGISRHNAGDKDESVIYVLPAKGGTPKRVTAKAPSYLHGWSPDGRFLIYTGGRDGNYDIYRIPVEGGDEVRLTDAPGLDDGPEYSPDGRFIYFNSARTGDMRIWRMAPDGSGQEPVTSGDFHDWFPHVSPDGKRIVFLSFERDVAADDHPFYKQVYIRMMPMDGSGEPKVIAYVYGGQGTINVPSWSPDGKRIAFVSNSR
jgi:Tol biopolymer transport system component/regulation of enolase protein 1 (concanavalin A-like superfamily)